VHEGGRPVPSDLQVRARLAPKIVVIGAGFSGTLAVIRLLDLTDHEVEIVVIEKDLRNLNGGLAFGATGAGWEHLLNIQAGRVSLFREEPDDFLGWANAHGTDKTGWPMQWRHFRFTPSSPVPRRVFAQYLGDRLATLAARRPRSSVRIVPGEAVSTRPGPDGVEVQYAADGSIHSLRADAAILATGHWGPVVPTAMRDLRSADDRVVFDPYSELGRQQLFAIPPDARVLIVGTGLTSCDVITTLHQAGHRGEFICLSRHGFEHRPYPADHLHDIPKLTEPPRFLLHTADSADEFVAAFLRDFARIRRGFSDLPVMVRDERTWKALEPAIAEFCTTGPPQLVRELLGRFKSAMVTSRIGTVSEIFAPIDKLRQRGRLTKVTGEISHVAADGDGLVITVSGADGDLIVRRVDRVVLACGRSADLGAVTDSLWSELHRNGYAEPEPVTRLGVATDDCGRFIRDCAHRLFVIGPMRQGNELVKHGRTGAFVFSIGTLRNQVHYTALAVAQLLRRLRLAQTTAGAISLSDDGAFSPEELHAIQLRVGYPMTRPVGVGTAQDTEPALLDLSRLERLEQLAVESLTDISKLAPEIEERVALQRNIKRSLSLTDRRGKTLMNHITVELRRDGATATLSQIRGHEVVVDRPTASEGSDAGPMGGELLLASIGGCFMSTFIAAARARDIVIDDASCEVIGTFADSPRRFGSVEVLVSSAQCAPDDLEHLVRVAEQGCIVMNTLRGNLGLRVAAK
jgi:uncharacterized NAD(P)/FAD-binding protein YdhS/uncharacterized OsmC-like protein